jgi:hypothetical protein
MGHALKLSLVDFIFVPHLIIAAGYFGYVQESPPHWHKRISAVAVSLWAGILIFGYFVAVWAFGTIMCILSVIIGVVFSNIGLDICQMLEWIMLGVIISIKYVVVLSVEAFVAKDRGLFSRRSLNFLDSDINRFVAVAKPICHILMIFGIIADLMYLISTGHCLLF